MMTYFFFYQIQGKDIKAAGYKNLEFCLLNKVIASNLRKFLSMT